MTTTTTTTTKATVLIVGAGIAGPTLGLQLLSHPELAARFRPLLIDRIALPPPPDAFAATATATATSTAATAATTAPIAAPTATPPPPATASVEPPPASGGAGVVLGGNSLHILAGLGLGGAFWAASEETLANDIWRAHDGAQPPAARLLNRLVSPAYMTDLDSGLRGVERARLQRLLVHAYLARGGEARWACKLAGLEQTPAGACALLAGGERIAADLVVGADGVWSAVRRAVLLGDDADQWKPQFEYVSVLFGIAEVPDPATPGAAAAAAAAAGPDPDVGRGHVVLTADGVCSTWPLPDGRQMVGVHILENAEPASGSGSGSGGSWVRLRQDGYDLALATGGYSAESSLAILKHHEAVWHPVAGSFGALFRRVSRLHRLALWQHVWAPHQIVRAGNVALVGDASRCMNPAAGQG